MIDDPLLPAAAHLTGPYAADVLRPVIERAGGILRDHRCTHVHYRPGHDVIAQFRTEVEWRDGRFRQETLLAAATASGPPAGSVVVTAEAGDRELQVGVWRWPFDPELPALEPLVRTPAIVLADAGVVAPATAVTVEVVAYRPTERAVLRVRTPQAVRYAKVVRPASSAAIVERHRRMRAHGLPVPEVIAADPDSGVMIVDELTGPTLRELVKTDAARWIEPTALYELVGQVAAVGDDRIPAFRSRLVDGPYHASLLATVLPEEREHLDRLGDFLAREADRSRSRARGFVHGDLHEAQLIVDDGRIVGLLDIDEAGSGDPIDDIAVPAAHLRHRALTAANGARITAFVDEFVSAAGNDHAPRDIAAGTVAVLAGLATAPFRSQTEGWERQIATVLELTDRLIPGE